MKKVIILSELFVPPYDEGMKVAALNLFAGLRANADCISLGPCGDENRAVLAVNINKLLYSESLRKKITNFKPDIILYLPAASATIASFIRYKVLTLYTRGIMTAMIALQHREYSILSRKCIKFIKPANIFALSSSMCKRFEMIGISAHQLAMGVDIRKYIPPTSGEKRNLRMKYYVYPDKYTVLHVGHIRESRNLRILTRLSRLPGIQVLILSSTSTSQDENLRQELTRSGIIIIDWYIPENQEIYQLADCYIFPVIERTGSIEFPLSILEAMACNLPVLTTPFGGLPEQFQQSDDFRYCITAEDFEIEIKNIQFTVPKTRKQVERFSWEIIAGQLLEKCKA